MPLERLFVPGRKRYVSREEAENTRELSKLDKQLLDTAIERSLKPIELVDARSGRWDAWASIEAGQLALGVDGGNIPLLWKRLRPPGGPRSSTPGGTS